MDSFPGNFLSLLPKIFFNQVFLANNRMEKTIVKKIGILVLSLTWLSGQNAMGGDHENCETLLTRPLAGQSKIIDETYELGILSPNQPALERQEFPGSSQKPVLFHALNTLLTASLTAGACYYFWGMDSWENAYDRDSLNNTLYETTHCNDSSLTPAFPLNFSQQETQMQELIASIFNLENMLSTCQSALNNTAPTEKFAWTLLQKMSTSLFHTQETISAIFEEQKNLTTESGFIAPMDDNRLENEFRSVREQSTYAEKVCGQEIATILNGTVLTPELQNRLEMYCTGSFWPHIQQALNTSIVVGQSSVSAILSYIRQGLPYFNTSGICREQLRRYWDSLTN